MTPIHKHTVSMSCLGPAGQHVELVGDFPDWEHPIVMREISPGDYQCSIALAPGVYRYKFRLNHRLWFSDPRATLIDQSTPAQNAILVIGGIETPFLFAPDRRHVALSERGRLVVQIELPRPTETPIELLVNVPGRRWESARFFEVTSLRGFRILRAELSRPEFTDPSSRAHFRFTTHPDHLFWLPILRGATRSTGTFTPLRRHNVPITRPRATPETEPAPIPEPPRLLLDESPAWLERAVFYSVFLDRWHRGKASPHLPQALSRSAPSGPGTFYGGDFDGLCESLDHIVALGVDALILTPVHPSPSPLRRASTDLLSVDPALGGEAGLRRLVAAAHARQMKVIVETSLTCLSARHPLFEDVLRAQAHSEYADWFHLRRFPVSQHDPSSYDHLIGQPDAPTVNLSHENSRRYMVRSLDILIRAGIDGLMFHGLNEAPMDFWRLLRLRLRRQVPDILLLGQSSGDNVAAFSGNAGMDAIHDTRHRESLLAFFNAESIDAEDFCRRMTFDDARLGPLSPEFFIQSLDTIDTPRFSSAARLQARLRLALTSLFFRPGPLCLTYGIELGAGFLDPAFAVYNAWRERPPMPAIPHEPTMTGRLIAQLSALRQSLRPLQKGLFSMRPFADRGLWIERRCGGQFVRAYLNASRHPLAMPIMPHGAKPLIEVNVPVGTPDTVLPGDSARLFAVGFEDTEHSPHGGFDVPARDIWMR